MEQPAGRRPPSPLARARPPTASHGLASTRVERDSSTRRVVWAIWTPPGASGDGVGKPATPHGDERGPPQRCARCRSEHVRELGAASSNLMWLACVDCSYVWMVRCPAAAG